MSTKLTASAITVISGDTLSIPITVLDDDDAAVDMTGATIAFAIVRRVGRTAAISTADSPQTASAAIATSVVTITVTAANTEPLRGTYQFECKATDGSGNEAVIAYGSITFRVNQLD